MKRYQIASARNWRVRKSNFTPGKLGSSSAVGPSTTRVPASKSRRIDWPWPSVVSPAELIGLDSPGADGPGRDGGGDFGRRSLNQPKSSATGRRYPARTGSPRSALIGRQTLDTTAGPVNGNRFSTGIDQPAQRAAVGRGKDPSRAGHRRAPLREPKREPIKVTSPLTGSGRCAPNELGWTYPTRRAGNTFEQQHPVYSS